MTNVTMDPFVADELSKILQIYEVRGQTMRFSCENTWVSISQYSQLYLKTVKLPNSSDNEFLVAVHFYTSARIL